MRREGHQISSARPLPFADLSIAAGQVYGILSPPAAVIYPREVKYTSSGAGSNLRPHLILSLEGVCLYLSCGLTLFWGRIFRFFYYNTIGQENLNLTK